tara:strand:- start:390 stop:557 length:168 start_codon:yes stop_codon:yes gene_type:complete
VNCFWCHTELLIDSDIDIDSSMSPMINEEYSIKTFLHCPQCFSAVEVLKRRNAFD